MTEEEIELKKQELELRKKEIDNNIKISQKRSKESISIFVGVVIAIIGLFGNIATNWIQGNYTEKLEKQKFEAELIKWALNSEDRNKNRDNLKFLLEGQLINDGTGAIKKLVTDTTSVIPIKSEFKCVVVTAFDQSGAAVLTRKKCSDDIRYLKDYIAGFTQASTEQNRTVKYQWIDE